MHYDTAIGIPKRRYFNAIDGLRLLASVNVVLFHLEGIGGLYEMGGSPAWFFRLVKGPAFHASLFFILGGFIFTNMFAHKMAEFSAWAFLKKRFRELYPLHLITTLTMAALYIVRRWGTDGIDVPKIAASLFMHLTFLWSICPLGTLNLNTPSWALSAMFLCYLFFGPALKWSLTLKNRAAVMGWMAIFFIPLIAWGLFYGLLGSPPKLYQFFHAFAPVRFFEFGLGILLARFFMLRDENKRSGRFLAIRGDAIVLLLLYLLYMNLSSYVRSGLVATWISYHALMIPLYLAAIYTMAIEKGVFARIMSLKVIQKLGRTSFYPYLIHIPLMSVITLFCERVLHYKKFLHSPLNIAVFVTLLYVCSYLYVYAVRNKRRERKAKLNVH
ncbi:MAG: acyltransferase [Chitinispirillales bacterium]|jgi:peptidoglycan/LPS O-acetylase OafA/YrhL|nr:acyltransferase [Chitinispirillales bacterium]